MLSGRHATSCIHSYARIPACRATASVLHCKPVVLWKHVRSLSFQSAGAMHVHAGTVHLACASCCPFSYSRCNQVADCNCQQNAAVDGCHDYLCSQCLHQWDVKGKAPRHQEQPNEPCQHLQDDTANESVILSPIGHTCYCLCVFGLIVIVPGSSARAGGSHGASLAARRCARSGQCPRSRAPSCLPIIY